jgi:hypothetical protein
MTHLFDDDHFLLTHPTYSIYRTMWDLEGGAQAEGVPDGVVVEFYASHLPVPDALHVWFTYDPLTRHDKITEAIS